MKQLVYKNTKISYTEEGKGTAVILLHGFFGDSYTLEPIASALAKDYCCISLELLGFGDSSKPDIRYLVADHVAFLQEFLIILLTVSGSPQSERTRANRVLNW